MLCSSFLASTKKFCFTSNFYSYLFFFKLFFTQCNHLSMYYHIHIENFRDTEKTRPAFRSLEK